MEKYRIFSLFIILIPTPDFPHFYYMLGGNLGSLLYGDVSVMVKMSSNKAQISLSKRIVFLYGDVSVMPFISMSGKRNRRKPSQHVHNCLLGHSATAQQNKTNKNIAYFVHEQVGTYRSMRTNKDYWNHNDAKTDSHDETHDF